MRILDMDVMMEILHDHFFVQALGFVAFVFGVAAFVHERDNALKVLLTLQCCFLSIHFWLLGAEAGSVVALIGAVRNASSIKANTRKLAWLFIVFYIGLGLYRYQGWVDVLPVVSAVMGTLAFFFLAGLRMRLVLMISTSLWIVHNFVVASYGPLLMEVVILLANIGRSCHMGRRVKKTTPDVVSYNP